LLTAKLNSRYVVSASEILERSESENFAS